MNLNSREICRLNIKSFMGSPLRIKLGAVISRGWTTIPTTNGVKSVVAKKTDELDLYQKGKNHNQTMRC